MTDIIREIQTNKLVIAHPSGCISEYSASDIERKIKFIDSQIAVFNEERNELAADLEKIKKF